MVKWPPTFEAVSTKGAGYWVSLPLTRSLPPAEPGDEGSPIADTVDGFRALKGERGTAVLMGVLTSQSLYLGAMDVLNIKGPLSRYSVAGIAVILLAIVELHRGGVLSY